MFKDDLVRMISKLVYGVFLFGLLISALTFVMRFNEKYVEYRDIIVEIKALDISERNEGFFIYGTGRINSTDYYVVYEVLEDSGIRLAKYPCDTTILYLALEETEIPYLTYKINQFGGKKDYKLYLPKDSLVQAYDLSLEG